MGRNEKIDIIKSVLQVANKESQDTAVFACAVKKYAYDNTDPMELAFENLCSRFDLFLNRVYHKTGENHAGLIILDESSHETALQKLAMDFRVIGTKWKVIQNILEVPLFVDSRASRAIQLADHIAYAVFRRYESKDLTYFDIIQHCFDKHDGKIHGLVHKHEAIHMCTCPYCITRQLAPGSE